MEKNHFALFDVDGDGEYEYIVKWDPSNSHDVSQKGYTGKCYIDCYKLDGQLLWRLDMGVNIRAGAHYTQFMVYDFNGDGKAEMAVKTAPGTKMTRWGADGRVLEERFITMPEADIRAGVSHESSFVCSADDYREHMAEVFMRWQTHPEVVKGRWPGTLEECFGIGKKYQYPLNREDAYALTDYFIHTYAPSRSEKNRLEAFEGFIYEGPEYLTMFAGDGRELETKNIGYGAGDAGSGSFTVAESRGAGGGRGYRGSEGRGNGADGRGYGSGEDRGHGGRGRGGNRGGDGRHEHMKTKSFGLESFSMDREEVNVRYLEQLLDSEQVNALAHLLRYGLEEVMDGKKTVRQTVEAIWNAWEKQNWKPFAGSFVPCGLAKPRIQELYACLNRFRG